MPLRYRQLLNITEVGRDVRCMSFSRNGNYIALGTNNRITLWDINAGSKFKPVLKTADPLSITWINESSFSVGYRNGSLYTFTIVLEEQRLEVSGFIAMQQAILHLSSNALGTELASAGLTQVGIWAKTISEEGALHWRLRDLIPLSPGGDNQQLRPISIAWFPSEQQKELLVVYESRVIVWDINTLTARKTFKIPGSITSGALSSTGAVFAVTTKDGSIQIWDVLMGIPVHSTTWNSKSSASVHFIHGEHALLVGGHAHADILESVSLSKFQTIWLDKRETFSVQNLSQSLLHRIVARGDGSQPLVNILEDYCNNADSRYLIATASTYGSRAVIWKGDESSTTSNAQDEEQKTFAQHSYVCFFFFVTVVVGFVLGIVVEGEKIMLYFRG